MPTVKQLYSIAKGLNIRGRSKMNKKELEKAISAHRSRSPKKRRSRSPKVKSLKKAIDKEPIITITCGDVAENHVGNQQIGHLVSKGQGFTRSDLEAAAAKFKSKGYKVELHDLNSGLAGVLVDGNTPRAEPASILIVRNGLEALLGKGKTNNFFNRLVELDWDKKFYDSRRKKVLNKHARHNLCLSKTA